MQLDDRELIARTLQAEAGNQGLGGMLAVGSVIKNRMGSGQSFRDVILAPAQFSAWNKFTGAAGGEQGQDMSKVRPSEDAYAAADALISGNIADITGGATHYYNPDISNPNWGASAGGDWTKIGSHVFGKAGDFRTGAKDMIGAQAPQQMAQQEQPRGLLGGMINRDFADQLYMAALAGSPNAQRFQPLIQQVAAGREARREDAKEQKKLQIAQKGRNATADYLDSIGQTDLGNLVRQGAITGANALSAVPKPDAEKRTAAMKEYDLAKADPKFLDFLKLKEIPETPAGLKKLDEQFATTLSGTSAQALAAARQDAASISSVLKQLEGGTELTGPILGSIPENLRAIVNPESVQAQQLVESVVQKNLRAILGGQFAQKEGEQLVRRAYNPLLPEEQNAARLRALLLSLDAAAQNKQAMEDYFYKNNYSLRGYSGPMGIPSMDEFEAAMEAAVPSPKGSITTAPPVGAIEDGYRFKGGDPSDANNWEKI